MKKAILIIIALFAMTGLVFAKEYKAEKKAGDYHVEIEIDRNPPVVGDNNIKIEIKDSARKYVTDAKVIVEYSMPPMPGMAPMNYKTAAELKDHSYRATMKLSMAGSWNIVVKFTRGGKTTSAKFTIDAQ